MSALPALEQGRAKQGKTQKSVVKLIKQRTKNKKRTKKKTEEEEEEEEEEEGPWKKRKKRTKIKKNEEEEEAEEDEEDEEQAEEEEEEKEDAKEEEPVAKKPRAATPDTKNKTVSQKRKSKDDMRFNGQNIDAAGPLGTLFKQKETKEKEAGVVAHQNSANVKVQMTNQFRKEAIERITLKKAADKQKKNKDSEEAKKTAAEQKKNTDSEEDKPQEEVLHGLSIEELKNLKIGDAIKTWYATHSKWFTGNVVKVHRCSVDVAYDDNSTALHRFDGGWIINRVS